MENFSVQMEWALLFSIIWAAFNLAFFAFLRGSEYTYSGVRKFLQQFDLSTECISFHHSLARSYCITVYLKSSKTNIAREGQSLTIAHTLSPLYAVAAMQEYFLSARPQHGPLFYFQSGRYLTPDIVSDLLRDSARVAGPPYQSLKEHTFASVRPPLQPPPACQIGKVLGRWSSDCWLYIRTPQFTLESVAPRMAIVPRRFQPI